MKDEKTQWQGYTLEQIQKRKLVADIALKVGFNQVKERLNPLKTNNKLCNRSIRLSCFITCVSHIFKTYQLWLQIKQLFVANK